MKKIFFVTATNTDIGKTYACEIFLNKFAKDSKKVGYFKPIETGVKSKPKDGVKVLSIAKRLNKDFNFNIDDIVPYQFSLPAAPFVAKKDKKIDINFILNQIQKLLKSCDTLIIEGAGGLMVPIE
ncbi:MAG: dethiobiotin synthase, partial [Campylobacterota bacterium]|nr:dethiobiotin synthase [Campylobacterota bacterium]